jgi:hypothetical protein
MPYNSYTNESDSRFAGQLDEYKLGLPMPSRPVSDGVMADSAFAVLPELMSVGRLMEMRSQAHRNAIGTRKEVAEDQSAGMAEDQYLGYSSRIAGLQGEELANAVRSEFSNDPTLARNRSVLDTNRELFESEKFSIQARSNILAERKQKIEERLQDNYEDTIEDRIKLSDTQLDLSLKQNRLGEEKMERALQSYTDSDQDAIGEYIASSSAFTEDESEYQRKLIMVSAHLGRDSDNPESRKSVTTLARITRALEQAGEMPKIFRSRMERHAGLLGDLKKGGFDLANLDLPPEEVKRIIGEGRAYLSSMRGVPPDRLAESLLNFDELVDIRAGFDRSQAELAQAKSTFFPLIEKMDALRKSPSSEAQAEIDDELAVLRSRAPSFSAHAKKAMKDEEDGLRRRQIQSQVDRRYESSRQGNEKLLIGEQRMSLDERKQAFREKMMSFGDEESRMRWLQRTIIDGEYDVWGFKKEPTIEELRARVNAYNPMPAGTSSTDLE